MKRIPAETQEQLREAAIQYASRYEVSEKKLRDYLLRKFSPKPSSDWIDHAIASCVKIGAVQNDRVREILIRNLNSRGKGVQSINNKLEQWGLMSIGVDQDNELKKAIEWITKWKNRNLEKEKILRRLMQRGFSYSVATKAWKEQNNV